MSFANKESAPAGVETEALAQPSPEEQFLSQLSALGPGASVRMPDGRTATAAATYNAASGRLCRMVSIETVPGGFESRLACSEGPSWAWQPYVLP